MVHRSVLLLQIDHFSRSKIVNVKMVCDARNIKIAFITKSHASPPIKRKQ